MSRCPRKWSPAWSENLKCSQIKFKFKLKSDSLRDNIARARRAANFLSWPICASFKSFESLSQLNSHVYSAECVWLWMEKRFPGVYPCIPPPLASFPHVQTCNIIDPGTKGKSAHRLKWCFDSPALLFANRIYKSSSWGIILKRNNSISS